MDGALPESEERPESQSRILVVDDHEDNIEVLKVRLESWGYRTDAVHDGAAALRYVEKNPPDLILLQLRPALIRRAREDRTRDDRPVRRPCIVHADDEAVDRVARLRFTAADRIL